MKRLSMRKDETVAEYLQRLKKTINDPVWQEERRRERFIEEWKRGEISEEVRQVGKKSPGAKFHSPERR